MKLFSYKSIFCCCVQNCSMHFKSSYIFFYLLIISYEILIQNICTNIVTLLLIINEVVNNITKLDPSSLNENIVILLNNSLAEFMTVLICNMISSLITYVILLFTVKWADLVSAVFIIENNFTRLFIMCQEYTLLYYLK